MFIANNNVNGGSNQQVVFQLLSQKFNQKMYCIATNTREEWKQVVNKRVLDGTARVWLSSQEVKPKNYKI